MTLSSCTSNSDSVTPWDKHSSMGALGGGRACVCMLWSDRTPGFKVQGVEVKERAQLHSSCIHLAQSFPALELGAMPLPISRRLWFKKVWPVVIFFPHKGWAGKAKVVLHGWNQLGSQHCCVNHFPNSPPCLC